MSGSELLKGPHHIILILKIVNHEFCGQSHFTILIINMNYTHSDIFGCDLIKWIIV